MAVEEQEIRSGTVEELAETVSDAEKREAVHNVRSAGDALFTWDYERSREALSKLYEKIATPMRRCPAIGTKGNASSICRPHA